MTELSWQEEARRVLGLQRVSMEIWVLKLLPLLPMDGCWYLVSEPKKRSRCHRLHFLLISACTCGGQMEKRERERERGECVCV